MVAVFASWPVGIAVHELGHTLAAKVTGASLNTFHIGLIDEYIDVAQYTSMTQRWFISLGAYPVVAAVGLASAALGSRASAARPAVRQLLIMGGLVQVVTQLMLLPLVAPSDWSDGSVIYDFTTTPGLSWAAGVAHGFVLLETWRWWSKSLRWKLRAMRHNLDGHLRRLNQAHSRDPDDLDSRLRLANLCTSLGDHRRAHRLFAAADGNVAATDLGRCRVALRQGRWEKAVAAADAGLLLPESEDRIVQRLHASRAIALVSMHRHAEAIDAFAELSRPLADQWHVRYMSALASIERQATPAPAARSLPPSPRTSPAGPSSTFTSAR